MKEMHLRNKKAKHKCRLCKGNICIHEKSDPKDVKVVKIPNIAEQSMDILEQLLIDKEGTPEEILKLGTTGELFQLGMDPFCITAAMGHPEGMKRFLKAGKDPNVKCTSDGSTPLMLAAQNRHFDVVEILLEHGADVTLQNSEGNNSFMLAVKTGDAKLVNAIWPYRSDIDINHANNVGNTALHLAAEKTWETCVQFLLANGAAPNKQNTTGWTPLMMSAMKGDMKTAERLLNAGGNLLMEDHAGYTAICWAHNGERDDMIKYLLSRMSEQDKDNFVKNRIERLRNPVDESEFETMFNDVFLQLFQRLAKVNQYRDILLRVKLVPNILSVVQRWTKNQNVVTGACNIVCSCMHQYHMVIDEKFTQQFVRSRGPEFCMKVLKYFSENNKRDSETLVYCFFPLVCINETPEGKEWIEKNCVKIAQYIGLKDQLQIIKYPDENLKMKTRMLWDKFWNEFTNMQQFKRDQKMKELLEDEERERMKRVKKREKKKQKRQRQHILKSNQTETRNDTETAIQESEIPFQDQIPLDDTENESDKKSNSHKNGPKFDIERSGEKSSVCRKTEKKDQDSCPDQNNEMIDPVFNTSLCVFQNELSSQVNSEAWTKVVGKKSQNKLSATSSDGQVSESGIKSKSKKSSTNKSNGHQMKGQRPDQKSVKRWADIIKPASATAPPNVKNATPKKKEETELCVSVDDRNEFPSLGSVVSKTKQHASHEIGNLKCAASRSESVVSSAEYWDSDDQGGGLSNQEATDEDVPVWLGTSSSSNVCNVISDVYWENTEAFDKEVKGKIIDVPMQNANKDKCKENMSLDVDKAETYSGHHIDTVDTIQFPDSRITWIQNMLKAYTDKLEMDQEISHGNEPVTQKSADKALPVNTQCTTTKNDEDEFWSPNNTFSDERSRLYEAFVNAVPGNDNAANCPYTNIHNEQTSSDHVKKLQCQKTLELENQWLEAAADRIVQNVKQKLGGSINCPLTLKAVAKSLIHKSENKSDNLEDNSYHTRYSNIQSGKSSDMWALMDKRSYEYKTNCETKPLTLDRHLCSMPSANDEMEKAFVEARDRFYSEHSDDKTESRSADVCLPKFTQIAGLGNQRTSLNTDTYFDCKQEYNVNETMTTDSINMSNVNTQSHLDSQRHGQFLKKYPYDIDDPAVSNVCIDTKSTENGISKYLEKGEKIPYKSEIEVTNNQINVELKTENAKGKQQSLHDFEPNDGNRTSGEARCSFARTPDTESKIPITINLTNLLGENQYGNLFDRLQESRDAYVSTRLSAMSDYHPRNINERYSSDVLHYSRHLSGLDELGEKQAPKFKVNKCIPETEKNDKQRVAVIQPIGLTAKDVGDHATNAVGFTDADVQSRVINQTNSSPSNKLNVGESSSISENLTITSPSQSSQNGIGGVSDRSPNFSETSIKTDNENEDNPSKQNTTDSVLIGSNRSSFDNIISETKRTIPGSESRVALSHMTSNNNSGGFTNSWSSDNGVKEYIPQGNCPLGESILRNALNIQHPVEDVGFLEDASDGAKMINNETSNESALRFPGFHDDFTPDNSKIELNQYKLELMQFIQLQNYFRQYSQNTLLSKSDLFHDTQYYACAMGLSKESTASITNEGSGRFAQRHGYHGTKNTNIGIESNHDRNDFISHEDNQSGKEKQDYRLISELQDQISRGYFPERSISDNTSSRNNKSVILLPGQQPNSSPYIPNELLAQNQSFFNDSYFSAKHFTGRDKDLVQLPTPNANVRNEIKSWKPRSIRWKEKLLEISQLPSLMRNRVGDIIIPLDCNDKFKIKYSDQSALLGFLADGTEVAVVAIDLNMNPLAVDFLQTLLSPHYSHYFLASYKAYAVAGNVCYLALELYEYTLAEYIEDSNTHPMTDVHFTNKYAWQILKGLGSLHENCGIPHGNLMPSNILIDVDGKLLLSEYGFPRRKFYCDNVLSLRSIPEDRACWTPTEVMTETELYSIKSDMQVAGMILYYILSDGKHVYGETSLEITVSIQQNWCKMSFFTEEITDLCTKMLAIPSSDRPEICDLMKHPYFWGDEKRLRFVLIAGSDVLRDLKVGVPITGSGGNITVSGGNTMIDIINAGECNNAFANWTSEIDGPIMKEMRSFRQYKNTLVELVLFVYNCCLHFDKLPQQPRDLLDEPCKYFLTKFPRLFMSVYRAIQASERVTKICYKPFF